MSEREHLEPCPVCGSKATISARFRAGGGWRGAAFCTDDKRCGISTPIMTSPGKAAARWNGYALNALKAERDALREALNIFVKCQYPADTSIDPRGYSWCEGWLDGALPIARAALGDPS